MGVDESNMSQDSLRLAGADERKECDILKSRNTLVKAYAEEYGIDFRTVSRNRKSPHRFYILRDAMEDLENKERIIVRDIRSFAVLHMNTYAGTLEIEFTWLNGDRHNISGFQESVVVSYEKFMAFVHQSTVESSPKEWKTLSIDNSKKQPRIVFNSRRNLCAAIQNGIVRKKLVRFLHDGFQWPEAEQIELCDDFMSYSFLFREIKNGKTALSGGLILHCQDDIKKSYYGIHT